MFLSTFPIIITTQLILSVTRPFDSSPGLYYEWSIVTVRLSCAVMEIWRLKCWTHGRGHGKKDVKGKEKKGMKKRREDKGKGKEKRKERGKRKGKGKGKREGKGKGEELGEGEKKRDRKGERKREER